KSLWYFVFATAYLTTLSFLLLFYLPTGGSAPSIDPGAPSEKVIQQLVSNQERLATQLEQIRYVFGFFGWLIVLYLASVVSIFRQVLNERKKSAAKNNINARPLGLDLN
ncbi:MAG TPA: hypothetical protein VKB46_05240, partial [Pyrinomonadaceae bacterium]|nr:hypothetical protein [Pyrinomonadaceae bacterium]